MATNNFRKVRRLFVAIFEIAHCCVQTDDTKAFQKNFKQMCLH